VKRRAQMVVLAMVLVVGALAGAAARSASEPQPGPSGTSPQCDLPVSQRTGGWFCPGATGSLSPTR